MFSSLRNWRVKNFLNNCFERLAVCEWDHLVVQIPPFTRQRLEITAWLQCNNLKMGVAVPISFFFLFSFSKTSFLLLVMILIIITCNIFFATHIVRTHSLGKVFFANNKIIVDDDRKSKDYKRKLSLNKQTPHPRRLHKVALAFGNNLKIFLMTKESKT